MPPTLVCVTVTGRTTAELRTGRDAVRDADLIELRLDAVSDPDVAGALAGRTRPVILTCRPAWEGGGFQGSEEERRRILADALQAGAEWVDVEWRAGFDDLVRQQGRRVVLSLHDFEGVPRDLEGRCRGMRAAGAEVVKLAVTARRLADCLPLVELAGREAAGERFTFMAMGEAGAATRILAGRLGCCWTYAGSKRELGQIDAERLLGEFRFRHVTATTRLFGLLGASVGQSLSPAMHNAAFAAAAIDAVYLPLQAADVADFEAFARAVGIEGASVTSPYKVDVLRIARGLDAASRRVGAANTLRRSGDGWEATNTDVAGFLVPLRGRLDLAGCRAGVLGAGGAARAVVVALGQAGARVTVHARSRTRAAEVAALTGAAIGPALPPPRSWDLLVNATPVGTFPRKGETPFDGAFDGRVVYDLVYNPAPTRLLMDAAAAGCETVSGLDMLVAQAELQFEWWTGQPVPEGVVKQAARARLRSCEEDLADLPGR